jgi:hypothetical protein
VNEARRKEIEKSISLVEEAKSILESASQEERDEFDELSPKEQESNKGTAIDAAASALEDSLDDCDALMRKLEDAKV